MNKEVKQIDYHLIGIGNHPKPVLHVDTIGLINKSVVFSGGQRHYDLVKSLLPANHVWIEISGKMEEVINHYQSASKPVVIFASGDPFFYGFGNTLKRYLPEAKIESFPYFSSIQRLCHKTQTNYNELKTVSVHGRDWTALDTAIIKEEPLIGVLTDAKKTPSVIANYLLQYGFDNYTITVGEELDGENEKVENYTLNEVINLEFSTLNCLLLHKTYAKNIPFGIPDNQFEPLPNRANMITKMPIRLSTINALDLKEVKTFWDIGSCTGSVAIEAKRHFPELEVIAFEKRPECGAIIKKNTEQFSAPGITIVIDDFFDIDLTKYSIPEVVFIGGHGNRLAELIDKITTLSPSIKVVINAVQSTTTETFKNTLNALDYTINSTSIQVDKHNTISIHTAKKIINK
jgi:precorrin-6Y C5,15-methyltransferase (decarboxylating)